MNILTDYANHTGLVAKYKEPNQFATEATAEGEALQ